MKSFCVIVFLCSGLAEAASSLGSAKGETNPVAKVLELLSNLQAKVIAEGEEEQKTYMEFTEWCEE